MSACNYKVIERLRVSSIADYEYPLKVRKDEIIEVDFPVVMRTTETAVDDVYETKWVGDNVVGITPSGVYYPLYKDVQLLDKVPVNKNPLYLGNSKDFD